MPRFLLLSLLILSIVSGSAATPLPSLCGEVVSTAAVVADGFLYAASYERESRAGHLRAFALAGSRQTRLWDAAERVPPPGAALPPANDPGLTALAPRFARNPDERLLFTNLGSTQGYRLVTFAAPAAHRLQPLFGVPDLSASAALINAVRGRLGTSAMAPGGSSDRLDLLGAISRSSPALVGGSPLDTTAAQRDRVLYVGAEDGLLHAILAGRWSATSGDYETTGDCGRELWAYLPGGFLPELANGAVEPTGYRSPVHVDGAPVVADVYIDGDGDGHREWRTVLTGTASVPALNRGVVFAFDVTDPYAPRLLWETPVPGVGLGRSRGAAITTTTGWSAEPPRIFLTAGSATRIDADGHPAPEHGSFGVVACALDLVSGNLLWNFAAPCPGSAGVAADAPTAPAIMRGATDGGIDAILFGDPAGRLWVLDPATGGPVGGGPAWQSPGGTNEPIGGGFALRDRLALFGTGGVEGADPHGHYAVYAVELLPDGARLLWSHPLDPGERLWGAPTLDRFGRAFFGIGDEQAGSGRILVVDGDGTLAGSVGLAGPPGGGVALVPGALVTVSLTGQVEQVGEIRLEVANPAAAAGRIRLFSWRMR